MVFVYQINDLVPSTSDDFNYLCHLSHSNVSSFILNNSTLREGLKEPTLWLTLVVLILFWDTHAHLCKVAFNAFSQHQGETSGWNSSPLNTKQNKALQWRHHGHDGVSNHQPHHCLLNRLCGRRSKKTSKLRVTGLCAAKCFHTMDPFHTYGQYHDCWWIVTHGSRVSAALILT